jgi:hypothetical protein
VISLKDEKKEILNELLEYFKESNINDFGYEQDKLISYEEAQIILDYITNLRKIEQDHQKLNGELREENKKLQEENERLNNIINELKWKPINQYDNGNYDWVLIKMFIKEDNFECVPIVAEKRMGVWKNQDGETLDEDMFEIKYFMDMQQIDSLELKEGK